MQITCSLYGFHTAKNFLSYIAHLMKGHGLYELLSLLYEENVDLILLSVKGYFQVS
jgi:hypothetical protein